MPPSLLTPYRLEIETFDKYVINILAICILCKNNVLYTVPPLDSRTWS